MIVGAGTSGSVILKEMMTSRHTNGTVVCFVDDDPKTAEILSKILLFAEDDRIKDPGILSQIR